MPVQQIERVTIPATDVEGIGSTPSPPIIYTVDCMHSDDMLLYITEDTFFSFLFSEFF